MTHIGPFPPEVLYEVYSNMSMKDLVSTLAVNRSVHEATISYLRHVVDTVLSSYSGSEGPERLCAVLRTSKGVVTGSNALTLLLGQRRWVPNNLDIAVPCGGTEVRQVLLVLTDLMSSLPDFV